MEEFHPRRIDRAIKERQEMIAVLKRQKIATIAMSKDDNPYLVTMDYGLDERNMCLYFHCARKGKKIDYLTANPLIWGEVREDLGYVQGDCSHRYRTVQFKGRAELISETKKKRAALNIMIEHLEDDPEKGKREFIEKDKLERSLIIKIKIEGLSGKESRPE